MRDRPRKIRQALKPTVTQDPGDGGYSHEEGGGYTGGDGSTGNSQLADMPAYTFKANDTAALGPPKDITGTEATVLLDEFTETEKGLVPAPGTATGSVLSDNGTWVANGSTPFFTMWNPDRPPASPSAYDDEFETAGAINGTIWTTTLNWASLTSKDVSTTVPGCLWGTLTSPNGTIPVALQAIPAGDFTIWTKVDVTGTSGSSANSHAGGLVLSDTNTLSGSSKQSVLMSGLYTTGPGYAGGYAWTNFTTAGAATSTVYPRHQYLRIRRSGTTYYFAWSTDGKNWSEHTFTPAATPAYMGLMFFSSVATAQVAFEFFRYSSSATAILGASQGYA